MNRCLHRFMILLIDFDGQADRLSVAKAVIPPQLADRVFVLGALTEPEDLKTALGTYETIGSAMADNCRNETDTTWQHQLLRHNANELDRLNERVRSFLF